MRIKSKRQRLIPLHTLNIISVQKELTTHKIKNYLELGLELEIDKGVFSPVYANSAKFVSWVITKVLKAGNNVLDIGACTGVLALTALRTLERLGTPPKKRNVVAVEPAPASFKNLKKNCEGTGIKLLQGALVVKTSKGRVALPDMLEGQEGINEAILVHTDTKGEPIENKPIDTQSPFDAIIADLPFVDATAEGDLERAFLDCGHRNQQALFALVGRDKNHKWLKAKGRLITCFSNLGGSEDVAQFEEMIAKEDLKVIQTFSFHEAGYVWMVYVIMRKEEVANDFWWKELNVKPSQDVQ